MSYPTSTTFLLLDNITNNNHFTAPFPRQPRWAVTRKRLPNSVFLMTPLYSCSNSPEPVTVWPLACLQKAHRRQQENQCPIPRIYAERPPCHNPLNGPGLGTSCTLKGLVRYSLVDHLTNNRENFAPIKQVKIKLCINSSVFLEGINQWIYRKTALTQSDGSNVSATSVAWSKYGRMSVLTPLKQISAEI